MIGKIGICLIWLFQGKLTVSTTNLFHSEDFIWSYEFILLLVSVGVPVSSKTAKLYLRLSLETGAYN